MSEPEVVETEVLDNVSTPEEKIQAAEQGWKEEAHPNFKTAREFLEFGNRVAPIIKKRNEHLERELSQAKQAIDEMRSEFFKMRKDAEDRGYKKAKADLLEEQRRAFREGDETAYNKASSELEKLEPPKSAEPKKVPDVDPEWSTWQVTNAPWYGTDIALTAAADAIGMSEAQSGRYQTNKEVWVATLNKLKEEFPHKFGNRTTTANLVETGTVSPKPKGKKTFANLPADIKAEADKVMKSFGYKDKEEYAAAYYREAEKYGWAV